VDLAGGHDDGGIGGLRDARQPLRATGATASTLPWMTAPRASLGAVSGLQSWTAAVVRVSRGPGFASRGHNASSSAASSRARSARRSICAAVSSGASASLFGVKLAFTLEGSRLAVHPGVSLRRCVRPCERISCGSVTHGCSAAPPATAAYESVEIIFSPSRNTWCDHLVDFDTSRNKVQCSASDLASSRGRRVYELRERGRSRVFTQRGDPGEGDFTARYNQWLYFYGGTAKLVGGRNELRCIFRRTGLSCANRSRHGFILRVGLHRRF
jgi:hypothetical protein